MGPSTIRLGYGRHTFFRKCTTVVIGNSISDKDVVAVKNACVRSQRFKAAVDIHIDSTGGSLSSAGQIADTLWKYHHRLPMRIVVTGNCLSAAIVVLLALPLPYRHGLVGSRYMIHCGRINGQRNDETRQSDETYINYILAATTPDRQAANAMKEAIRNGTDYVFPDGKAVIYNFIW